MTDATERVEVKPETLLAHAMHIAASRFRQGAGIHIRCKERGITSWQQWLQHPKRSWLRHAVFQIHLWVQESALGNH